MGQRHQIYVRLPAVDYGNDNPNTRGTKVIGVHHQWLYGSTACEMLAQFLRFVEQQGDYGPFKNTASDAQQALSALYSVMPHKGYFHSVHNLTEDEDNRDSQPSQECTDPRCGDNNNGITVIDLSGDKPKYAFVSIGHLECLDDSMRDGSYENFKPMSAHDYLRLHYPDYQTEKPACKKECSCAKNTKLRAEHLKERQEFLDTARATIDYLGKHDVLTLKELKAIFPAMYKKNKEVF